MKDPGDLPVHFLQIPVIYNYFKMKSKKSKQTNKPPVCLGYLRENKKKEKEKLSVMPPAR